MTFATPYKNKYYEKRKRLIASVKIASGCVDCKVWGPDTLLSFDHVQGKKEFNIGSTWDVSLERLTAEIAKCEVVCHNCHALREERRRKEAAGPVFTPFPKVPRLNRDVVITEKLDGSNGTIWIDGDGEVWAGSKNRWLTLEQDNFGFAKWVDENANALANSLGEGVHRGEWWGRGIQRGYGLDGKRFSLFNTNRWGGVFARHDNDIYFDGSSDTTALHEAGVRVVPSLYEGPFSEAHIKYALAELETSGSFAAPGFEDPEGIIIYHTASNSMFKVTIFDDAKPKGSSE